MKIVFFGTPQIAAEMLQYLIDHEQDVVMVVTKPDKPKGRSSEPMPPPVKIVADKYFIPILQPEKISNEDSASQLQHLNPDLFVVVAYGEILKQNILDIPLKGSINVHASLLPKYRGAAPIQRAILNGEKETGVSIIRLVQKMDAGPTLLKKSFDLSDEMNSEQVFSLIARFGKEALLETIKLIEKGEEVEELQNESLVTFAPKIDKSEEVISFSENAIQIHRRIKGVYPYAFFTLLLRDQPTKIFCLDSQVVDIKLAPEEILDSKTKLIIGTPDKSIEILRLKQEGRKALSAEEWLRSAYHSFSII